MAPVTKGRPLTDEILKKEAAERSHKRKQRRFDHMNTVTICAIWLLPLAALVLIAIVIGHQLSTGDWASFEKETYTFAGGVVGYVIAYLKGQIKEE
jgi:hypothetical protein